MRPARCTSRCARSRHAVEDLSTDRRIVAICRSGARSRTVAEALVGAGFDVVNVGGGMRAWEAADLPVETDDGSPGSVI